MHSCKTEDGRIRAHIPNGYKPIVPPLDSEKRALVNVLLDDALH